jgi:rhamnose utilization protein RhaD (predicted bifunctional aldolase and dehydrogenase)/NAD(P)-dependent dehydrogenase (short-subunit alcohol dehydrogenase family)
MSARARRSLPPPPAGALAELIELSNRFGRDPEFSRGGGGNSSFKADGILYIKPSGVPLASLTAEALVALDIEALLSRLDPTAEGEAAAGSEGLMAVALEAGVGPPADRRPSVELLFHALLPERFVLHTHPVMANAVCCNRDGADLARRLFGERGLWVPYTDPGLPLARAIWQARRAHEERTGAPAPHVVLLESHGVIVAADSVAEIAELSHWLARTVRAAVAAATLPAGRPATVSPQPEPSRARELVQVIGPTLRGLLATGERLPVVTFDDSPLAVGGTATPAGRAFLDGGPLTPDQIVYAGSWPLVFEPPSDATPDELPGRLRRDLETHARERGGPPIVVVVPGLGLFAAGASWAQADTARHIFLDAMRVGEAARALGEVRPLAEPARRFIEDWEAEEYRRSVAAGASAAGRASGLVAVVTGAAQGFGQAIATDLVAQGAHVVLADLNAAQATANATGLEARFGPGRAFGLAMDVTDEGSVAEGIDATVRRYGGLDLLVSNAGVLRAGGVTAQPLAEFDLVTRVNYRGYFLAVRFAAPIMARQHRARPAYLGNIIEINSKSGLAGSSRNSAYAGSKFGGIGLTQSFALELMGEGIKVNAICPGNYLDGPLWSDPQSGLFVQYLREGKVPGAETVDDVRRFYEAKVPMGRGCTPADVMEALYYLVAQTYETGQALPVTGGQVMLS